jgi:hypothetical protein
MILGNSGYALANLFNAPVDYIDVSVRRERKILRGPEPLTVHRVHADAVVVVEYSPCGDCSQHCFLLSADPSIPVYDRITLNVGLRLPPLPLWERIEVRGITPILTFPHLWERDNA